MMQVASYDFDQFGTKNLAKPFRNETLESIFKTTLGNSSVEMFHTTILRKVQEKVLYEGSLAKAQCLHFVNQVLICSLSFENWSVLNFF